MDHSLSITMPKTISGFDERLNKLFKDKGCTKAEFMKGIGVSKNAANNYLLGDALPSIPTLVKICGFFNVSADYLIFGKEK